MSVAPGPHLADDPIARTRLSWIRTVLALIVLGFLLVRGVLVLEAPVALIPIALIAALVAVSLALGRFIALGRSAPRRIPMAVLSLVVAGVLALVVVGVALTLLATTLT